MKNCITCLFQGDNSVNVDGEGKVFCMVECKWKKEQDSCPKFVEYADLSKEIRYNYANQRSNEKSKIRTILAYNWYMMIVSLLISFVLFVAIVKIFDKYIF